MMNNNALFAEGAYQWVLSQAKQYEMRSHCTLDMEATLRSIEKGGHDVKISFFEPQADKAADVIVMLEWVDYKKEKISFLSVVKENYAAVKRDYPDIVNLFKMNGRIRYMEELNAGNAAPPTFLVEL